MGRDKQMVYVGVPITNTGRVHLSAWPIQKQRNHHRRHVVRVGHGGTAATRSTPTSLVPDNNLHWVPECEPRVDTPFKDEARYDPRHPGCALISPAATRLGAAAPTSLEKGTRWHRVRDY